MTPNTGDLEMNKESIKQGLYEFCCELFPICRSITGDGVRETLHRIREHLPALEIHEVPTGTQVFDWIVPREWNIRDAYILDPDGRKIVDFQESNLHVVGYSLPVDQAISLDDLQVHLHSLPEQPDAVPYITSYYQERWGFCLNHTLRQSLKPGMYRVFIDSDLKDGHLTYGELILPGELEDEIFLSTYICHPSMANNELSGPAVTTYLARWLMSLKNRKYTYRIVFIPETIGSITYLSRHESILRERVIAGFNVTCIGDGQRYSYLESRYGDTLADRVARHVLSHKHPDYMAYSFLDRGSDERQYCSPGIDLPLATLMCSKYGTYPEYHTSLDNLDFITPEGLYGGYELLMACLQCLEANETLMIRVKCEPQLGRRGLYPTLSTRESNAIVRNMMNLIAYADGRNDLLQIADRINLPMWELFDIVTQLKEKDVIEVVGH